MVGRLRTACAVRLLPLLLLMLPDAVQAQFTYTTNNGTITVTGYTGPGGDVTIPDRINGLPVTTIGGYAFYEAYLNSVTIPNSVTTIGDNAFYSCTSLTSVTIGTNVTSIGDYAFEDCYNLGGVTIPNSVTSIGDWAFGECTSLASVTIPDSVISIGGCAFSGCTSLTSVTRIGENAFSDCASLSAITVDQFNSSYSSLAGVLLNKSQTTLIQCPGGKAGSYMIPDSVLSIEGGAFYGCSSLTSVTIPDSVLSIGNGAFGGCSSLTSIIIPDSVISIVGYNTFMSCASLTNATIGNSVNSIVDLMFSNCTNLTGVTIPNSVTSIGARAFFMCRNLASVTIGNGVTRIRSEAFQGCTSLTNVTIPSSVTSIGEGTFSSCSSLTNVTIPNSVTSIDDDAFGYCPGLTSVSIPGSVTFLGIAVFCGCSGLTEITVDELNPAYSSLDGILFNKSQTKLIQYLGGRAGSYTIPSGVTSISTCAFADCPNLTSVTIGDSVISIQRNAFVACTNLTNVTIGNGFTSIGDGAFSDCNSLTSVTIGNSVTSIGDAFSGCTSLTAITVDELNSSFSSVAGVLFNKSQTTIIRCPEGIAGSYVIPDSVTSIGGYAFSGCACLTDVTIPKSVVSLGDGAFVECINLTKVFFQGNAPDVGLNSYLAFYGDYNTTVYYLAGTTGWGETFCGLPTVLLKDTATVALGSLSQIYDGVVKPATAMTTPSGLTVNFTYNGSPDAPIDAGTYLVIATVNDPAYTGSASGTLTVLPVPLKVTGIAAVSKVYDGTTSAAINTARAALNGVLSADAGQVTLVTSGASGAFADKAAGTNKPVMVTGLALAGTDAGNYTLIQPTFSANITPATLTVTGVTAANKVYDGTRSVTISTSGATLHGVLAGDTGNVIIVASGASGAFADKAVGNNKPVTVSGLALSGSAAGNYTLSQPTLTASITPAGLTISGLAASSKVYDGTTVATITGTPVTTGVIGSDAVSVSVTATGAFGEKAVGNNKPVTVSSLTLSGTDAGNYTLSVPLLSASITPAPLTVTGVTAANKVYDGTTSATINTAGATLHGVLAGDTGDVTLVASGASGAFADKAVGNNKPVTVSGLSLGGSAAGNYTLTQPTLTANITPAGLAISGLAASSRVYDGTTVATITGTPVATGVIGSDAVALSGSASGAFGDKAVGNNKPVTVSGLTLSGSASGNYTLIQPTLTANITPAGLTISGLAASSKVYDGTTIATLTGTPVATGVIGSYAVSLSGTATGALWRQGGGQQQAGHGQRSLPEWHGCWELHIECAVAQRQHHTRRADSHRGDRGQQGM